MSKELHSSYWLDIDQFKYDSANVDLVDMMEYRQTIKNFVTILTGKDIPVKFKTSKRPSGSHSPDGSFTDGKSIQIAALRRNSKFDVNVGLALHEASHVVLTDFSISDTFRDADYGDTFLSGRFREIASKLRCYPEILLPLSSAWHMMTNLFEDVRIDEYVIKSAPGYKGYYDALYEEYLYCDAVKNMMLDSRYRSLEVNNYIKHLLVYKRPDRIPNALPGLAEMYDIIDNTDIAGMSNTYEVAEFAGEMLIKVCEAIESARQNSMGKNQDGKNTSSSPEAKPQGDDNSQDDSNGDSAEDTQSTDASGSNNRVTSDTDDSAEDVNDTNDIELEIADPVDLKPKEQKQVDKAIKELNDFINHKLNENGPGGGSVKEGDAKLMNRMDEKARITKLPDFNNIKSIYIPKVKPSDYIGKNRQIGRMYKVNPDSSSRFDLSIKQGLQAAKLIERRLSIREEERVTVHNHLKSGRVDNRRLAYATVVDDIFKKSYIESYPESYIHISVDASSSMSGGRIHSAIEMLVALVKGTENLNSIHLKIDFRGTMSFKGAPETAVSVVAYDSKYNSVNDFLTYIRYMSLNSITPESLCYEAIAKDMMRDAAGKHALFITLTDGEPNMTNTSRHQMGYNYITAGPHIQKMMKKFHGANIATLAYFIDGDESRLNSHYGPEFRFKESYGSAGHFIKSGDFRKLLTTINNVELSTKVVNIQ